MCSQLTYQRPICQTSHLLCTGTGVIFDLFTLGALISASLQFQTDSAAFMAAVKEIAGASGGNTGINVVDKAAQARSTLKVLQALSNISNLLKVRRCCCCWAPQRGKQLQSLPWCMHDLTTLACPLCVTTSWHVGIILGCTALKAALHGPLPCSPHFDMTTHLRADPVPAVNHRRREPSQASLGRARSAACRHTCCCKRQRSSTAGRPRSRGCPTTRRAPSRACLPATTPTLMTSGCL